MRIAGVVFLVSGIAYLAWDISLILAHGIHLGSGLMIVFAAAFLYQGLALYKRNRAVLWGAIASALFVAVASAYIASAFIVSPFPQSVLDIPAEVLPLFVTVAALSIAFGLASVVLVLSLAHRSNAP